MARGFQQHDPDRDGTLEIKEVRPDLVEVYFVPPERSLVAAGLDPKKASSYRTKLLDIHDQHKFLTIYPISTFGDRDDFLKPKYGRIVRITLHDTDIISRVAWDATSTPENVLDVLENLPAAFTKDYAYGLGLAKPYRFIVDAVEALSDCTEIAITGIFATGPTHTAIESSILLKRISSRRGAPSTVSIALLNPPLAQSSRQLPTTSWPNGSACQCSNRM